jgi:hypothetical protein
MNEQTRKYLVLSIGASLLLGAGGCLIDSSIKNFSAPNANAGKDQQVDYDGQPVEVQLDGTKSRDTDVDGTGTIVKYQWQSNDAPKDAGVSSADAGADAGAGPVAEAPDPKDVAKPKVLLDRGTWKFTLWVTDNDGQVSKSDSVTVRVGGDPVAECLAASFPAAPEMCRTCLCGVSDVCRKATAACQEDCWGLISCIGSMCPPEPGKPLDTSCVASMCIPFLAGVATATAVGPCITPCMTSCTAP